MKKTFIILIVCFNISLLYSQPFVFRKHTVDPDTTGYSGLFSDDIDGNGYPDIAGTSLNDNRITIWLNNGRNITWKKIIVDSLFPAPLYIHISDINNDGRPDLAAGSGEGEIAWWESDRKNISHWIRHVVDSGFAGTHGILACDMNNDGNTDILSSSAFLHTIAWWENRGNNPPTWTKHTVCDNFHTSQSCYAIDIDNDEDMDVLGASSDDDEIAVWYNLNGSASRWEKQTISDSFDLAHWVYSYDLDNDGDNDIMGAACIDGEIVWWENDGQKHPSWTKHLTGKDFACALTALSADFNNDNYPDIYASAWSGNEVSIWENPGNTNSAWVKHIVDTTIQGAWPIHANDFDKDGDIDLLAGGDLLNRQGSNPALYFYENQFTNTSSKKAIFVTAIITSFILIILLITYARRRGKN